ncbi:MAG: M20/M25/M40 family metallo-hydrolase [Actinomycetota bacterium]|nr:M20/M25/M40 family metallo-hydrolase [Actinomycetota bacterium]
MIRYETSRPDELVAAAGFVRGWIESREIEVRDVAHNGLSVLIAEAGSRRPDAPCVVLHGHLDVVPGRPEQFEPVIEGDRLIGRGAYDMKGGLAAMMCALKDADDQDAIRVRLICVPDEESEDLDERSTDAMVSAHGLGGDFAITGEPTNLHIGIQAKGVLVLRIVVHGRAAHSSTPWLGDNAVLKAIDVFRAIESLPFSRESSEMFDRPSINLGRIEGGDALNKVPDRCEMAVDVRYLPGQDPGEILAQVRAIAGIDVTRTFIHPPVTVSPSDPYVRALRDAVSRARPEVQALSVGRDGASDAAAFIEAGIPAVEFGPSGAGHHGPEEWVSITSLSRYRQALGDFVRTLATAGVAGGARLGQTTAGLTAIDGGRA